MTKLYVLWFIFAVPGLFMAATLLEELIAHD